MTKLFAYISAVALTRRRQDQASGGIGVWRVITCYAWLRVVSRAQHCNKVIRQVRLADARA
jgi:hypothetical protein